MDISAFMDFLKSVDVKYLNSPLGDDYVNHFNEAKMYRNAVSNMVNTYSFDTKKMLDVIFENKKLADAFEVLAAGYVSACSKKWRPDAWDKRDFMLNEMCHRIILLTNFSTIYPNADYNSDCNRFTTHANSLVHGLTDMHPTNRQTFGGFVLSFLMHKNKKLYGECTSRNLLSSKDVHFFMI